MIGRVEGHRDGSRNHLRRGYGGQEERKGRKGLNHGIHGNGRARWSHRNPLSSVLRRQSFSLPITNFSRVEHVEVLDRINRIDRIEKWSVWRGWWNDGD